jgi:hypothetical protein
MAKSVQGCAEETESFQHEALDQSKRSIRLIRVLPQLSHGGLIQCSVIHTTIDAASWTCLSYRWGTSQPLSDRIILLNGRSFLVHENLFNFLQLLQLSERHNMQTLAELSKTLYWIDAMCIDQRNNRERNHQVTQLGEVFARAKLVHIWLRSSSNADQIRRTTESWLGRYVRDCDDPMFPRQMTWNGVDYEIFDNEYWSRAWVTQEIILAHTLIVSLGARVFHYADIFHQLEQIGGIRPGTSFDRFNEILNTPITRIRGSNLLYLLWCFNDKICSVTHGNVYSLLSLCEQRQDRSRLRYFNTHARLPSPGTLSSRHVCMRCVHCSEEFIIPAIVHKNSRCC